jgi:ABC-type sugar transport system ATPase subunit
MAQVSLKHIRKSFGAVNAISELSLDIRDREFFVLLGPTGAGKSTTLRCIAGLEQPEAGDVFIAEQRVNEWSAAQRDVALVFQQYSLYPNYTVRENLAFPLSQGCATSRHSRSRSAWPRRRPPCASPTCWSGAQTACRAARCNACRSAAPSCASRACS